MTVKELTCIVCPLGCRLKVALTENGEVRVEGARCQRGVEYGRQEVTQPRRIVMTVVRVRNGEFPTVSVKTDRPVPKECIERVMKATVDLEVEAPVEVGEVLLRDICGASLVATRRVRKTGET
ncbi:DUF1667 domain-containing protein [Desulfurococcus mucosus]|uniref:DUF1667 domain-containing protein n=1 Tax=Desulfurococcus mucosus TaxID=2275 RepID=UPI00064E26E2|nr:DUF1667 domain-containing protein [Desulfurococcus mucosus]